METDTKYNHFLGLGIFQILTLFGEFYTFHLTGATWLFLNLIWQFHSCLIHKMSNTSKFNPLHQEGRTTNSTKLYHEICKYEMFRISFSR